nr:13407_t:CDS:2 [Entrophospora candida]
MGLGTEWGKNQQYLTQKSQQAKVSAAKRIGLEKDVSWKLLINLLPFGLLILEPDFIGASFAIIWDTLNNYDNLKGKKISTEIPIKKIIFENVSFKYQEQKKAMIFNQIFVAGEVNYLTSPNGSGKTTKLYLLLGLLTPQKGKIIIQMRDDKNVHNLSELDLVN